MVLDDVSLWKASWYLRLSTSFFIWGTSHSSMASGASEAASLGLEGRREQQSQGAAGCSQSLDAPPPQHTHKGREGAPPAHTDTSSLPGQVPMACATHRRTGLGAEAR